MTRPTRTNSNASPPIRITHAPSASFHTLKRTNTSYKSIKFSTRQASFYPLKKTFLTRQPTISKPEKKDFFEPFHFYDLHDVQVDFGVKIISIEGFDCEFFSEGLENQGLLGRDLYIECELCTNGMRIGIPYRTTYKSVLSKSTEWNQWLRFCVQYSDLPLDAMLCITLYDFFSPKQTAVIAGGSFRLFTKLGHIKTGPHKLRLWPFKAADPSTNTTTPGEVTEEDEITQIQQMRHKVKKIGWLDKIVDARVKQLKEEQTFKKGEMYINIELPRFDHIAIHTEKIDYDDNPVVTVQNYFSGGQDSTNPEEEIKKYASSNRSRDRTYIRDQKSDFVFVNDLEVGQKHPAEEKHLLLSVSLLTESDVQDLKPTTDELKAIQRILDYPTLRDFSMEDKTLMWKFRYYLRSNKKALVKFLKLVHWDSVKERKEAIKLMQQWEEIDTVDALELLSKYFKGVDVVRNYAVNILKKADDDEIMDILLQLVQSVRYESQGEKSELATFLIERALKRFPIANNLNWYLRVESEDPKYGKMFENFQHLFWVCLKKNNAGEFLDMIIRQERLVQKLVEVSNEIKSVTGKRERKIGILRGILHESCKPYDWHDLFHNSISKKYEHTPLKLPLASNREVTGIYNDHATIFKSAKSPMLIPFKQKNHEKYNVIWKVGDDLRQDQLVLQLVTLMDKLLRKNGLDLKLTPYSVIATSVDNGFVECVTPSSALSAIIAKGDIQGWLKKHANGDMRLFTEAKQNFIKSCAGYCVITYILGIGDRHLDNILLTPSGTLFHIDFGFILGRDPKPLPPPMKLCKEMVVGMGGTMSEGYMLFKSLCCTAFNILRKHAQLIINLFVLMVDANIPDIVRGPDPMKNIMKVQEKFKLELNDEEASMFMQSIITESEKALFPQITETLHRWAQYWRS